MSNVLRVMLSEEVTELVVNEASQAEAFTVLNRAVDIQENEQREMTLDEALECMRQVAAWVEAMG
jgi:hypothetical protein